MSRRRVIVDGYNVIKQDPDLSRLERLGLETARQALLARLRSHPFLRGDEIIVVFDGAGQRATMEEIGGVRVVFSEANETADEMILRLADAAPADAPVLVLSDDLEVRREAFRVGATAKAVRRRPREGATYDDHWHKEADSEEWSADKAGKKKGSPRRPKGRRPRDLGTDGEFVL
jgi:predicted RNA-binding protein with PIN domain